MKKKQYSKKINNGKEATISIVLSIILFGIYLLSVALMGKEYNDFTGLGQQVLLGIIFILTSVANLVMVIVNIYRSLKQHESPNYIAIALFLLVMAYIFIINPYILS
ncbi:hypothetical protein KC951_00130 [Candidatus Saccharibacteria bacterium]|nr:hypothetical protein [Candidatus Saccharibacteria bacterium]